MSPHLPTAIRRFAFLDLPQNRASGACSDGGAEDGSALQTALAVVAALAIVALAAWSFVHFGVKPVEPTGLVEQIRVYPIHRESTMGGGFGAAPEVKQPFDQVLVLVKVKIDNPGNIPIYVRDMSASVTLLHGETNSSTAAGASDFNRVFIGYPETAPDKQPPLLRDTTVDPGKTGEGLMIFNYPLTKDQWASHSSMNVTISFVHQSDLVLQAPDSAAP